ncbi:fibronectin type III domain-containing protein [Paenibacillus melissococcoides]|uniref:Fibronectin type III domain-containing protein n=1 Tax=Paenibacillus melissococcoides TaxID=2912268 RepID=A0ABM9GA02_9BACL|nr:MULTISPECIES: fibronectin type III domain-containing protein [Paenibacillus]GIO81891.1 hypothetical protein J6TS7_55010 [Paenibacillus dendritiformis]CAH8248501.1 fibronectin type III domain-containing protein [Paenibacillus melissococcoides]CAH8722024.1 fibronectin type III domain-containing protein [Paenibacillus melissococcoides]CAH8722034.1 fibronectin type III domain-containing protein [Paenibacillus melissococcoides]
MKKGICTLLACLLLALTVPVSVSAYPGGLLDGQPFQLYTKDGLLKKTIYEVTDGLNYTGWELSCRVCSDGNTLKIPLKQSAQIKSYRISMHNGAGGANLSVYFQSKGNQAAYRKLSAKKNGVPEDYDIDVKDVDEIIIQNNGSNGAKIYEFDVFGEYDIPRPTKLRSEPDTRSIRLTWLGNQGANGYVVYVDGERHGEVNASTTEYEIRGLEPDRKYRIQVQTIYQGLMSGLSEVSYATPYDDPLPEPQFQADAWNDRLRISWTENGAVNYISCLRALGG